MVSKYAIWLKESRIFAIHNSRVFVLRISKPRSDGNLILLFSEIHNFNFVVVTICNIQLSIQSAIVETDGVLKPCLCFFAIHVSKGKQITIVMISSHQPISLLSFHGNCSHARAFSICNEIVRFFIPKTQ